MLPLFYHKKHVTMNKGTHFIGQPLYGQLINLLDKSKILGFSRDEGGERYVKHFDGWQHLVVMLYAVIKRFNSLREISASMLPEARKLAHLGISIIQLFMPMRMFPLTYSILLQRRMTVSCSSPHNMLRAISLP